jgi:nucleoside-diphosphate-sugar epimerase
MNILVTGSNGFLGSNVIAKLLEHGHQITAQIRPAAREPSWASNVKILRCDLRKPQGLAEALHGIDTVLHIAAAVSGSEDSQFASTVGGTEQLLSAMVQAKTPRLVLISSFVVYDWKRIRDELTEDSPVNPDMYDMGGYTIAKSWQERIVARHAEATGCKTIVLRPGFIWGKDHAELAGMGRNLGKLFLVIGPLKTIPLTHVVNCADCVVKATEAVELQSGEVFNVIDGFTPSTWAYTGSFINASKRKPWRVAVPYWMGLALASTATRLSKWKFGKRGQLPSFLARNQFEAQLKPLRFSTAKLEDVLHWKPPLSYDECLKATYPKT